MAYLLAASVAALLPDSNHCAAASSAVGRICQFGLGLEGDGVCTLASLPASDDGSSGPQHLRRGEQCRVRICLTDRSFLRGQPWRQPMRGRGSQVGSRAAQRASFGSHHRESSPLALLVPQAGVCTGITQIRTKLTLHDVGAASNERCQRQSRRCEQWCDADFAVGCASHQCCRHRHRWAVQREYENMARARRGSQTPTYTFIFAAGSLRWLQGQCVAASCLAPVLQDRCTAAIVVSGNATLGSPSGGRA